MKQIYLVRHCQAAGQEAEAPLTKNGIEQAEQLVSLFDGYPIDRIVSSPFHRAIATIQPLAEERGLTIEQDRRLEERILSGQPMEDWLDRLRDTFDELSLCYEGGESSMTAIHRANELLTEVLSGDDNHVVLVSHGCLLTLLMKSIDDQFGFKEWQQLKNPDVYLLTCMEHTRELKHIWNE